MNDDITPRGPAAPQGPRRFAGLRARTATAAVTLGLIGGGVAGGLVISQAATTSSSTSSSSAGTGTGGSTGTGSAATTPAPPPGAPGSGAFHPNEDPTHESGESAQREAQENAGQMPTVP